MTILVDWQIMQAIEREKHPLVIRPLLDPIQPASVDLRLGTSIIVPSGYGSILDPGRGVGSNDTPVEFTEYALTPNEFVIVSLLEHLEIPPGLVGILVGKSSLARIGLQVESAGYVDPGWKGKPSLELKNLGHYTIMLRPGMKICQLRIEQTHRSDGLYGDASLGSHYQGSTEARTGVFDPVAPDAAPPK